ncbi:uncharacterized protein LOC131425383 isoform X2 [Malaya genurostris]|uniref:uncharacterized protein LOC131425383 isoform X2 n=1 Tax=Malaya genurostris TaxID=325434 RepID=UPI0026F39E16|nr:uncharacterized protein LOC131425383 isoform X2 [Malaya genurostris]
MAGALNNNNREVQIFHSDVLLKVLSSKRLLIDHVEILEVCLDGLDHRANPWFTAPRCLILSSVSGVGAYLLGREHIKWSLSFLTTSTIYGLGFFLKWMKQVCFSRRLKQISTLIRSLEQFEAAVKKNVLFLNECNHVRSAQLALDKLGSGMANFATNCFRCIVEVIKIIHASIKMLELDFPLDERWDSLYMPMEELEGCETFLTDAAIAPIELKVIKDVYNIFAYVQSQYLTRLVLSIVCSTNPVFPCSILKLSSEIQFRKNACLKYLNRVMDYKREKIPNRQSTSTIPAEVLNVRSFSLTFVTKLLNTAHRFNLLEEELENSIQEYDKKSFASFLESMEASLETITNDLLTSTEECQRLLIMVKKILNKENVGSLELSGLFQEPSTKNDDLTINHERVFSEQDEPVFKDEFFAVVGSHCDFDTEKRKSINLTDDLEAVNSKIVKRHFKPVLEQLRERIEPIGVQFKQREKQALLDKGIDWVELEVDDVGKTTSESDSDDQGDDERDTRKFRSSVRRYDEVSLFSLLCH